MPFHFCADELQALIIALPFLGSAWLALRHAFRLFVARLRARTAAPVAEPKPAAPGPWLSPKTLIRARDAARAP